MDAPTSPPCDFDRWFAATIAVDFRAVLWRKLKTLGRSGRSPGAIEFGTIIQQTRYCTLSGPEFDSLCP
jgi:hypothetical protein